MTQKTWTAENLVDYMLNGNYRELNSEMFWSGGFNSSLVEMLQEELIEELGVTISDPENLDREAYNAYVNDSDKGLT